MKSFVIQFYEGDNEGGVASFWNGWESYLFECLFEYSCLNGISDDIDSLLECNNNSEKNSIINRHDLLEGMKNILLEQSCSQSMETANKVKGMIRRSVDSLNLVSPILEMVVSGKEYPKTLYIYPKTKEVDMEKYKVCVVDIDE